MNSKLKAVFVTPPRDEVTFDIKIRKELQLMEILKISEDFPPNGAKVPRI